MAISSKGEELNGWRFQGLVGIWACIDGHAASARPDIIIGQGE
jgi:hypothetical protein